MLNGLLKSGSFLPAILILTNWPGKAEGAISRRDHAMEIVLFDLFIAYYLIFYLKHFYRLHLFSYLDKPVTR